MSCNNFLSVLFLLAVLSYAAHAQTADNVDTSQPMSLEVCLEYAFQNNATVENASLERRIARADVGVTKAQGLPQLNANVTYDNNFAIQTTISSDLSSLLTIADNVPTDAHPPGVRRFGVPHTGRRSIAYTDDLSMVLISLA